MKGSEGLPVNVQVAALPWQEEMVLRVMKEIENGVRKWIGIGLMTLITHMYCYFAIFVSTLFNVKTSSEVLHELNKYKTLMIMLLCAELTLLINIIQCVPLILECLYLIV